VADKRKKADAAAKAAAYTAFNTEIKRNPKPKNPNDGVGPKPVSWEKTYRSLNRNDKGLRPPTHDSLLRIVGEVKKPAKGPKDTSAIPVPKPRQKPAREAPKAVKKPSYEKGPASGEMAYSPPKFSGNWQGAAPTEMQKRGGARKTGNGGLLGVVKRKLGKQK
jgi:hypothetical protein